MGRKTLSKKVLMLIISIVVMLSTIGAVVVSGAITLPWRKEENLVKKILQRDGYLEGIWYPWLGEHAYLGCSLTSNEVMVKYVGSSWKKVGLDQYGENNVYRDIYNLKALGFNIMGYEGSPYGEGVVFDDNGDVLGIKEEYLQNVRRLLEICRKCEMPVLWTINFHSSTLPDYYGMDSWNIISQMYCNPVVTEHYVERFVTPLCTVLAEYPDVVAMVSAMVEAENEVNDSEIGNHFSGNRAVYGVTQKAMLNFITRVNETLAEKLPDVSRTLCSNDDYTSIYSELDLDFLGRNRYASSVNVPSIDNYKATVPMLVTEFGYGDGTSSVADEVFTIKHIQFREDFIAKGYKGWFMWCWQPNSFGTSYSLLAKDGAGPTDFRPMAYSLHYFAEDYRNQHRGQETVLDAPSMFFNTGSGRVEWIGSRQASAIDLMRSLDGGKTWTKLLDHVVPSEYESNYKGLYEDKTLPDSGNVMYKVVAFDGDLKAESAPTNNAEILGPPVNLVKNHDFETGDLTDWTVWGENGKQINVSVTKMDVDGSGADNHVLDFAYLTSAWYGVHQDGLTVKPNTNYKLTFKYKKAEDCTASSAYCYIRTKTEEGVGNGKGDIYDGQPFAHYLNKGSKDTWTTAELQFRTADTDKLGIDFRVLQGVHFYIDDITLTEVR